MGGLHPFPPLPIAPVPSLKLSSFFQTRIEKKNRGGAKTNNLLQLPDAHLLGLLPGWLPYENAAHCPVLQAFMLGALLRPHLGQRLDAVASASSMEVAPAFTRLAEYAMQPDATRPAAAQVLMKPLLTARELLTLRKWAQRVRGSIFGSTAAVGHMHA